MTTSHNDRVNTADIARLFRVSRRTVTDRWTKLPDFPPPVQVVSQKSRLWRLADVLAWRASPTDCQQSPPS